MKCKDLNNCRIKCRRTFFFFNLQISKEILDMKHKAWSIKGQKVDFVKVTTLFLWLFRFGEYKASHRLGDIYPEYKKNLENSRRITQFEILEQAPSAEEIPMEISACQVFPKKHRYQGLPTPAVRLVKMQSCGSEVWGTFWSICSHVASLGYALVRR